MSDINKDELSTKEDIQQSPPNSERTLTLLSTSSLQIKEETVPMEDRPDLIVENDNIIEEEIDIIPGKIDLHEENTDVVEYNFNDIEQNFDPNECTFDSDEYDIEHNVDSNEYNFDSNEYNVDSNEYNVDQNENNVDPNKHNVDSNEYNVDSNEYNVDSNEYNVDSIEQKVDSNEYTADSIEQKVDSIEQKIDLIEQNAELIEHSVDLNKQNVDLIEEKSDSIQQNSDSNDMENTQIEEIMNISEANFFVKILGLPIETTTSELGEFIGIELSEEMCKFTKNEAGNKNGEAFVIVDCEEVCRKVLSKHNYELRGKCIEIYPTCKKILSMAFEKSRPTPGQVVHIKATKPEMCTKDRIYSFIENAKLFGDEDSSMIICKDITDRITGEAYIHLKTTEMAVNVLGITGNSKFTTKRATLAQLKAAGNLNRLRLISLVRKKAPDEAKESQKPRETRKKSERKEKKRTHRSRDRRSRTRSPIRNKRRRSRSRSRGRAYEDISTRVYDDRKLPTDHYVRIFGLSNNVVEQDVLRFFSPLDVVYVRIERRVDLQKLPSALAFFRNHYAAVAAMKNDRGFIGSHCVRLSLFSSGTPPPQHPVRWAQPPVARPAYGQTGPFRGYAPSHQPYFPTSQRQPSMPERGYNTPYQSSMSYYRPEMPVQPTSNSYYYTQRPESNPYSPSVPSVYPPARPAVSSAYKRYTTATEIETPPYNSYVKNSYTSVQSRPYTPVQTPGRVETEGYARKYPGAQSYEQSDDYYPRRTNPYTSSPKRTQAGDRSDRASFGHYSEKPDNSTASRGYLGGQYSSQSRYTY